MENKVAFISQYDYVLKMWMHLLYCCLDVRVDDEDRDVASIYNEVGS